MHVSENSAPQNLTVYHPVPIKTATMAVNPRIFMVKSMVNSMVNSRAPGRQRGGHCTPGKTTNTGILLIYVWGINDINGDKPDFGSEKF